MKIKATAQMYLTIRLIEVQMNDMPPMYMASIWGVACGSGTTPEEAYRGLAHCLAHGDMDVDRQEAVVPWQTLINEALDRSRVPVDDMEQTALPFLTTPQGEG